MNQLHLLVTRAVTILLLTFSLIACKADIDFTVEQKVDQQGNDYATLSWDVQPIGNITPTRVILEPGFGDVNFTDSVDVFPTETTLYSLTVYAEYEDGGIANTVKKAYVYVGPRIDYELFTDTNFRTCLEETGFTHVEQFKTLICTGKDIQSIQGIEQLTDLQVITLDVNRINDLSPLRALENVHTLSLSSNQISDLSSFPFMPALTNLVLTANSLSDITPLMLNPQLLNLAVNKNQISDAEQFVYFENLTNLTLGENRVTDIAPLGDMTSLQVLDAKDNLLNDGVWELRTLENAVIVDLRGNGNVKCLEYGNLLFVLGTVVLFDDCQFPPPETNNE